MFFPLAEVFLTLENSLSVNVEDKLVRTRVLIPVERPVPLKCEADVIDPRAPFPEDVWALIAKVLLKAPPTRVLLEKALATRVALPIVELPASYRALRRVLAPAAVSAMINSFCPMATSESPEINPTSKPAVRGVDASRGPVVGWERTIPVGRLPEYSTLAMVVPAGMPAPETYCPIKRFEGLLREEDLM